MRVADELLQSVLLKEKIFTANDLAGLMLFAKNQRMTLPEVILEQDILTDKRLGELAAKALNTPFICVSEHSILESTLKIIPERIARKYKMLAFKEDAKTIDIATTDPSQREILDLLSKKTGKKIKIHFATDEDIDKSLQLYKKDLQDTLDRLLKGTMSAAALLGEAPIAKIVDVLFTYASREKASDIHIEPEENGLLVRFRIDSVLHDVLSLDKNLHARITTRIKVLAKLRTDEHLSAQDGKMRVMVDEKPLDIRVSILPVTEGEKVVLRLLSTNFKTFSLAELGMDKKDIKKVTQAVQRSYGMILSTGPTGSGKTTSIYSLLKGLNTREKNITTIEDPVEYRIKGVNQIQVNTKTNLTFASGLRSILRQDPNVIFVGEIRDSETASIAVNAALTGHLVLSTLHTNDAATALPRLIDMKVEPFLVASTVNVIIAQRLVRQICSSCKEKKIYNRTDITRDISEKVVEKAFGHTRQIALFSGKGCALCHFTGMSGRIGIFEVMIVSDEIKKRIIQKEDSAAIEKQAVKDGMITMLENGLMKVTEGKTTLEEVLRVIKTETL